MCQLRNAGILPAGILPAAQVIGCFVVVDPKTLLQRLTQRGESPPTIRARLLQSQKEVLRYDRNRSLYDLVIVNQDLKASTEKLTHFIQGEAVDTVSFDVDRFLLDITEILAEL